MGGGCIIMCECMSVYVLETGGGGVVHMCECISVGRVVVVVLCICVSAFLCMCWRLGWGRGWSGHMCDSYFKCAREYVIYMCL